MAGQSDASAKNVVASAITVDEIAIGNSSLNPSNGPFASGDSNIILVKSGSAVTTSVSGNTFTAEATIELDEANNETIRSVVAQDSQNGDVWRVINHTAIAKENDFRVFYEIGIPVQDG